MIGERLHPILYSIQKKRKKNAKSKPSQITPTCFGGRNLIAGASSFRNLTKTRRSC